MKELIFFLDEKDKNKNLALNPLIEEERVVIVSIQDGVNSREIFRQTHWVSDVQKWLSRAMLHIFDPPPECIDGAENILESLEKFYANASDEELGTWVDSLYQFREIHDLRFAFRGCNIPSALLGSKNGSTCIWYSYKNEYIEDHVFLPW